MRNSWFHWPFFLPRQIDDKKYVNCGVSYGKKIFKSCAHLYENLNRLRKPPTRQVNLVSICYTWGAKIPLAYTRQRNRNPKVRHITTHASSCTLNFELTGIKAGLPEQHEFFECLIGPWSRHAWRYIACARESVRMSFLKIEGECACFRMMCLLAKLSGWNALVGRSISLVFNAYSLSKLISASQLLTTISECAWI